MSPRALLRIGGAHLEKEIVLSVSVVLSASVVRAVCDDVFLRCVLERHDVSQDCAVPLEETAFGGYASL